MLVCGPTCRPTPLRRWSCKTEETDISNDNNQRRMPANQQHRSSSTASRKASQPSFPLRPLASSGSLQSVRPFSGLPKLLLQSLCSVGRDSNTSPRCRVIGSTSLSTRIVPPQTTTLGCHANPMVVKAVYELVSSLY
jgi:hypothetical protein